AHDGVIVAAVENTNKQANGRAVFYDTDGNHLSDVEVGALPDMITFTPDGNYVLVANEGEPSDDYTVDPEGSVSVIDLTDDDPEDITQANVATADFTAFNGATLDPSIRIFGPGATVAQDLEPEFIAITKKRGKWKAHVVIQENNAMAIVDVKTATVTDLVGLGFKNHNRWYNAFDPSNEDGAIQIAPQPTKGMYQPDAVASYRVRGRSFLIMANEGDARDYPGFSEETRVADLTLDPTAFPDAATLQLDENLGRLKTTTVNGDIDNDGDHDKIFSYGARSFSIRRPNGSLVFDSGAHLEVITAIALPGDFNSDDEENGSFDDRSDDKGPEPEGVVVAKIRGRHYAFIGLERVGGIAIYDVTYPYFPLFVDYINTRDFAGDPVAGTAGDMSPE
ncbi:MAG: choice-of-anchor I family protein, partial [Verrucomicrobiota bacterium]